MCKKMTILLALMISIFAFSGCSISEKLADRDADIYEKIHHHYSKMERYSATLSFTMYSNKTQNQYKAEQKAIGNDKFYTKITSDKSALCVTTITNGPNTKTWMEGGDYTLTVPSVEASGLMFVNRFFADYYSSEETALAVGSVANGNVTLLETELPHNPSGFSKASLTVHNETLMPKTLTIYDFGGKEVLKGEFTEFIYNDKAVEETAFSTD